MHACIHSLSYHHFLTSKYPVFFSPLYLSIILQTLNTDLIISTPPPPPPLINRSFSRFPLTSEMGFQRNNFSNSSVTKMIFILVLVFAGVSTDNYTQQVVAVRSLLIKGYATVMEINEPLQRGPVPPSAPSPCTYIPGHNQGRCEFANPDQDQMAVARSPPAFPDPDNHTIQNATP